MELILLIAIPILAVFSFLNLFILIYLAAFLVRLRGFVVDVLSVITEERKEEKEEKEEEGEEELSVSDVNLKTWDQKYEEELDLIQRQIRKERGQSGLMNLE